MVRLRAREWFALLENAGAAVQSRSPAATARRTPALPLAQGARRAREPDQLVRLSPGPSLRPGTAARPATAAAARARSAGARAGRADADKLPDEDGTATRASSAFRTAGWLSCARALRHQPRAAGRRAQLCANTSPTAPGALRTTLKRKAKKVAVEVLTSFESDAWAMPTRRSTPRAGSPRRATRRCCAASPRPKARAGPALRRACAARGRGGRRAVLDRQARHRVDSRSSPISRAPGRCRPGPR